MLDGAPTESSTLDDDSFAVDEAFVPHGADEADPAEDAPFSVYSDDESTAPATAGSADPTDLQDDAGDELVEFAAPEDLYLAEAVQDEDMFLADSVTAPAVGVAVEGGSVGGDREGGLPVGELMEKRLTG